MTAGEDFHGTQLFLFNLETVYDCYIPTRLEHIFKWKISLSIIHYRFLKSTISENDVNRVLVIYGNIVQVSTSLLKFFLGDKSR